MAELGDVRSDIVSVLAVVIGQAKAEKTFTDLENLIKKKAGDGAEERLTPIVNNQLKPLLYAAIAAGALGGLLGIGAIVYVAMRQRKPKLAAQTTGAEPVAPSNPGMPVGASPMRPWRQKGKK